MACALLCAGPARAAADDDPFEFYRLEAMQTTVSRIDEKVDETPGSVYVFTRRTIHARGYRSLGELLQAVPGFTVFHRDLDFVAGVRGLNANDNEKISLLVNGQNVNGVAEPSFLNGPINLDNVERVEVVVGPSSLFQPANTLAATVNVITRDTRGAAAVVSAGNALPYSATVMAGKLWPKDRSLSLSLTTERKRGFDAWGSTFRPNLVGRDITGQLDSPSWFGVLQGRAGQWSGQALAYRMSRPELLINNAHPRNDGRYVDEIYAASLKNEHPWTANLTGIFRAEAAVKEQTRLNSGGPPLAAVEFVNKQRTYAGELGLRHTGFTGQTISAGVQGSYDDNYDTYFTYNDPAGGEVFGRTATVSRDTRAVGFYADDTIRVHDKLKLVAGARVDHNTRLAGRWFLGARAAAVATPADFWVAKLIYNRAVRIPSAVSALNEAWGRDHLATSPSWARISPQAREPEILSTYELQNVVYIDSARFQASLYHQELSDFITWFSPHSNVGNFHGNGVELSLQAPLDDLALIWANASWNDSKLALFRQPLAAGGGVEAHHAYTNPNGRIIGSAEYVANVGLEKKVLGRLKLAPSLRYFTNQAALDHSTTRYLLIQNRVYVDCGLTWERLWGRDADLRLSGRNILDDRRPVGSQMNGDTYRPRGAEGVLTVEVRY
ncbi:MAG: TonB-dependent receptor [Elusimicrobia bacterium]|nr:TonB-dependent receptor [Elusimicrobiota bacterium]